MLSLVARGGGEGVSISLAQLRHPEDTKSILEAEATKKTKIDLSEDIEHQHAKLFKKALEDKKILNGCSLHELVGINAIANMLSAGHIIYATEKATKNMISDQRIRSTSAVKAFKYAPWIVDYVAESLDEELAPVTSEEFSSWMANNAIVLCLYDLHEKFDDSQGHMFRTVGVMLVNMALAKTSENVHENFKEYLTEKCSNKQGNYMLMRFEEDKCVMVNPGEPLSWTKTADLGYGRYSSSVEDVDRIFDRKGLGFVSGSEQGILVDLDEFGDFMEDAEKIQLVHRNDL